MAETVNDIINKGVLIDPTKLDFWLGLGLNVLLVGKHGVGKTQIIKGTFERNGVKGLYLSGSTLDPWVDIIGIPEIVRDDPAAGGQAYSDIIPPKRFALGQVEALFIDELNRAPKKVRNAVMELIQFKTINGVPFPNLKVVLAAINPHDEEQIEYDVEPLDPALEDRFQVKFTMDYRPCPVYMVSTFGKQYAGPALKWWAELPEKVRDKVSPRRLCDALNYHMKSGDVRDILPYESHPDKLAKDLGDAPALEVMYDYIKRQDFDGFKKVLEDDNYYRQLKPHLIESTKGARIILPLLSKERLMSLIPEGYVMETMVTNSREVPEFQEAIQKFIDHNGNKQHIDHIVVLIKRFKLEDLFKMPKSTK